MDQYSCFPFESYLGKLLKLIRGPAKPLQQVACRLFEKFNNKSDIETNDIQIHKINSKINYIRINGYKMYPSVPKDSHILLSSKRIMVTDEIIEKDSNLYFRGSIYLNSKPYYNFSSELNIFKVSDLSLFKFTVNINEIVTKCVVAYNNNSVIAIGMLHRE